MMKQIIVTIIPVPNLNGKRAHCNPYEFKIASPITSTTMITAVNTAIIASLMRKLGNITATHHSISMIHSMQLCSEARLALTGSPVLRE